MAKILKPLVHSGGYYPTDMMTPLVYPGGYTTFNSTPPREPVNTFSGEVVSFNADKAFPVVDISANIVAVQSGSGDPSPSNVRPIIGFTGCTVTRSGAEEQDTQTYSISWQSKAGTAYGGTIDVTSGLLTVTHTLVDLGSLNWSRDTTTLSYPVFKSSNLPGTSSPVGAGNLLCTCFKVVATRAQLTSQYTIAPWNVTTAQYVGARVDEYTDAAAFKEFVSGQMLRYKLRNPVTYSLHPVQVMSLVGLNTIRADTGNVTVQAYGTPVEP